jgi:hypothetical protein
MLGRDGGCAFALRVPKEGGASAVEALGADCEVRDGELSESAENFNDATTVMISLHSADIDYNVECEF